MPHELQTINYGTKTPSLAAASPNSAQGSTAPSSPHDWTGRSVGEYQIESLIGMGGNGQVYRAVHRWLDLPVAVKLLTNVNPNDEQSLMRFQREARIAARMNHPNIVRCTDGGVVGEQLFLVTDFVAGENVRDLVHRAGRLSVADACEVIRQTANALQFISDSGTVHRDIKPSNIMVSTSGDVRVLDMGLARCSVNSNTLTETGQVMGTMDFMSPEQATDTRHVDSRSDMYSLGCTFYFLLTGQAPFASAKYDSVASKLLAHIEATPAPIKSVRRDVPNTLVRLIDRMLEKAPELRPQTFEAIAIAIEPFSKGHRLATATVTAAETQQPIASAQNSSDSISRITDAAGEISMNFGKALLCGLGFLDRQPSTRPGQRPQHTLSFRWLKPIIALAFVLGLFSFLGFEVVPWETRQPTLEPVPEGTIWYTDELIEPFDPTTQTMPDGPMMMQTDPRMLPVDPNNATRNPFSSKANVNAGGIRFNNFD